MDKGSRRHLRWRKHLDHGARRHLCWWHRMGASPRWNLRWRQWLDHGTGRNLHRRGLKISTIKRETTAHRPFNSESNERLVAVIILIHELMQERYSHTLIQRLLFSIKENAASEFCCAKATSPESNLGFIDVRYPIPHMQQLPLN